MKHDPWMAVVISITIIAFVLALFLKGLTKDILLEIGVLTISIKLILLAEKIMAKLNAMEGKIDNANKAAR